MKPEGKIFKVTITETYKREVMVAEGELKEPSVSEAKKMVLDWWRDEQIILNENDFSGIEISGEEVK